MRQHGELGSPYFLPALGRFSFIETTAAQIVNGHMQDTIFLSESTEPLLDRELRSCGWLHFV